MGSRLECLCGNLVYTNHFYMLIKDTDYDAVEAPVDYDKLSNLFWKGIMAYRCGSCGRLIVEWDGQTGPTFYLPEGQQAEIPEREPALAKIGRADNQEVKPGETAEAASDESSGPDEARLKALEAIAEAAYSEMYDSSYPTGRYSDAKEAFYDAIALATKLGRRKDVERLEKRLEHIKNVFRHQFV